MSTDIGWIARLVLGPERLFNAIDAHLMIVLTGVGLDVQKLVEKSVDVDGIGFGFVSNGFLLPLFYLGFAGFLLTLVLWVWVVHAAAGLQRTLRATGLGSVAAMMALIFADNYSFLNEMVVAMLFLVAGVIAGERYGMPSSQPFQIILDEVQNVPEVFAFVRSRIDRQPRRMGQWFLTGSQEAPFDAECFRVNGRVGRYYAAFTARRV